MKYMSASKSASCRFVKYFTNHLLRLRLFLHPSCRSEFDLDYDSYHEDYYDRYCQKATHGSSHTLLLVCVSQEAKGKEAELDSSSLLSPVVSAPRHCLPHSLSVIVSLPTVLPVTTQQPGAQSLRSRSYTKAHALRRSFPRTELLWGHSFCGFVHSNSNSHDCVFSSVLVKEWA